ncbi:MAG: hypothetical protein KBT32_04840 [Bacteroidales bacterium]|nr:hypothetical protein [Candidatus Physcocola equi]
MRNNVICLSALLLLLNVVVSSCDKKDDDEPNNTTQNTGGSDRSGELFGHDYVDLGLPSKMKWATSNIGAASSLEYGDTFSWGQTKADDSDKDVYEPFIGADAADLLKKGVIDGVSDADKYLRTAGRLVAEYDAAAENWGGSWRMPTLDDLKELQESCFWVWCSQSDSNGKPVLGYKVTGPNGNYLFFPVDTKGIGEYWASSASSCFSCCLDIFTNCVRRSNTGRSYKYAIRPVSE